MLSNTCVSFVRETRRGLNCKQKAVYNLSGEKGIFKVATMVMKSIEAKWYYTMLIFFFLGYQSG